MGVACTPSGLILVADAGRESLILFDSDGRFVLEIAGPAGAWPGLIMPHSLAVLPFDPNSAAEQSRASLASDAQTEWALISDTVGESLTLLSIRRTESSLTARLGS